MAAEDLEILGQVLRSRFETLLGTTPRRQVPAETDAAASLR